MTRRDEMLALTPAQISIVNDMFAAWVGTDKPEYRETFRNDCKRLLSAQAEPGYVVKPLEWCSYIPRAWSAETSFETYRIYENDFGAEWFLTGGTERLQVESVVAAKVAAQADFEQRIRSAITATVGTAEPGYVVKPLEWDEREGEPQTFDAHTSIGHYVATVTDEKPQSTVIIGQATGNYMTANIGAAKTVAVYDYEQRIRSSITATVGTAEPAGVVVPRIPTPEMIYAMHHKIDWCRDGQDTYQVEHPSQTGERGVGTTCRQDICEAYAAMLAALPAPATAPEGEEVTADALRTWLYQQWGKPTPLCDLLFSTYKLTKRSAT